nr:MAG TPA: hypothetical protein [Caudoviricetes sp.]
MSFSCALLILSIFRISLGHCIHIRQVPPARLYVNLYV